MNNLSTIKAKLILHDLVKDPDNLPRSCEHCLFFYQNLLDGSIHTAFAWYHNIEGVWKYINADVTIPVYNAIAYIILNNLLEKTEDIVTERYIEATR